MGFFGELSSDLRERKRVIAAVFAFACIAVATFLAGTWAGSSGIFTLHPVTARPPTPTIRQHLLRRGPATCAAT